MHFGGCGGCGVGVCDQNGKKCPPSGKTLQIAQKFYTKALFSSRTHTKAYSEKVSSIGGF